MSTDEYPLEANVQVSGLENFILDGQRNGQRIRTNFIWKSGD
jgi:hypothetical protein